MESAGCSAEEAMERLQIPAAEAEKYLALLKES